MGGGVQGGINGAQQGAQAGMTLGGPVGGIIGAIWGGISGSKGVQVPKPPTYEEIMSNNITSQENVQSQLLAAEGKWRPQYQTLQEQTLNRQMYGGDGTQGYLSMLNASNQALQGLQGTSAGGYLNTLGGIMPQARQMAMSPQMQGLQGEITRQATQDLYNGTNLSQQDSRNAWQNANSAMAMSGMSGRQRVAAGVLSNYNLGIQRQDRARQYAGQALQSETAMQNAAFSIAGNAMNQYNAGTQFMGQANQMLGQYQPQIFNPEAQMGYNTQIADWKVRMGVATGNEQALADAFSMSGAQQRQAVQNGGQAGGGGGLGGGTFGSGPFGTAGNSFGSTASSLQSLASLFGNSGGGTGSLSAGGASMNYGSNYNNYSNMA